MIEKYGFVYIWYDVKKKMYYVGCHWGNIHDGYICSSKWMKNTFNRRPQDFRRKILKTNLSREEMYVEEQRYFSMIKSEEIKIRYYNLDLADKNVWHKYPESIKTIGQKISYKKKGKSTGPCSPEKAAKISEANTGKKRTNEVKEKLRQLKLGTKHSQEWKKENSKRIKEQWNSGQRKAKETHTEETKQKMSQSHKGKKLPQEQIEMLRKINSKQYFIHYFDGYVERADGLKNYSQQKQIPYVTLHKAFLKQTGIPKYKIKQIDLLNT